MTLDLIDTLIFQTEVEEGIDIRHMTARGRISYTMAVPSRGGKSPRWSEWEDDFLKKNLGWISEEEIARQLGRTQTAVHLRWKRDLHLPAPSRHPNYITATQAANLIGIDGHKIMHWCDMGLIPARELPGERRIRIILRVSFDRWVVSPSNWIYFDWKKIPDRRLYRLCKLRAQRWGDEWWSTAKAGKYHGVTTKDVLRQITIMGKLPGVQVAVSLGGRHHNPTWLNWFVKRSDVVNFVFVRGKGAGGIVRFSKRAERWMLKAYRKGIPFEGIKRSMGSPCDGMTIRKNILRLLEQQKT